MRLRNIILHKTGKVDIFFWKYNKISNPKKWIQGNLNFCENYFIHFLVNVYIKTIKQGEYQTTNRLCRLLKTTFLNKYAYFRETFVVTFMVKDCMFTIKRINMQSSLRNSQTFPKHSLFTSQIFKIDIIPLNCYFRQGKRCFKFKSVHSYFLFCIFSRKKHSGRR